MFDNAHLIDRIERSIADEPWCPVCHAPTTIRDRDGSLWLECSASSEAEPTGVVARLEAAMSAHPRRLVLDLADERAA